MATTVEQLEGTCTASAVDVQYRFKKLCLTTRGADEDLFAPVVGAVLEGDSRITKHMASNLLRQIAGKDSLPVKRKITAWDDDCLTAIVARK